MGVLSLSILDKSYSIVADNESAIYRLSIVAAGTVSALSSDIAAELNLLRRLRTILVHVVLWLIRLSWPLLFIIFDLIV